MNTEKIGYVEAIALIAIVMINKIILNTPKDIIANTRIFILAKRYLHLINFNCCGLFNSVLIEEIPWL